MAEDDSKKLVALIMSIVLIAVFLVIGIYINSLLEISLLASNTGITINGEAGTITAAGYQLAGQAGNLTGAGGWAVTSAINTTSGLLIAPGNYTVSTSGLVTNATARVWSAVTFNYTYIASVPTAASLAANGSVDALASGTPWLTILVVVGFAVIVLGYLTSGFGNAGKGAEGPAY